ncbi:MAG: hypothetical protein JXQ29_16445 [Planctomycetes bacterium]|nr:hypothetical protein [Planctomycetota bacterium]
MKGRRMAHALAVLVVVAAAGAAARAQDSELIEPDGTRTLTAHRLPLYHAGGEKITLDDDPLLPFSTRVTCGRCHDYTKIRQGWHFSATDPAVRPGRPGEPWILFDRRIATQLALSYRGWPGTYRPGEVGLTPWLFTRAFGGYLPGGGTSEPEDPAAERGARWFVSGKLEIDCLHCHHADRAENPSEWAVQVSRQNFLWAAAAASDLAVVTGTAAEAPDAFDPFLETGAGAHGPRTVYDRTRFNARGEVFFDVVRRAPPSRCYFCHSSREVGPGAPEKWREEGDVHLVRGLGCADCHRNGLDHRIVRGYEGEAADGGAAGAEVFTCRGCHLGATGRRGGRLAAPVPRHAGLPPVHLEKLACTACHSGPVPGAEALRTQTSASHRMGVHGAYRGEDAPPYLFAPVFLRQPGGVIAPHKVLWPSFFGTLAADGTVRPLDIFVVREVAGGLLAGERAAGEAVGEAAGDVKAEPGAAAAGEAAAEVAEARLDPAAVRAVLERLAARSDLPGTPVFLGGGRLYRVGDGGGLAAGEEHPAAAPYAWPLAHDVRPAAESLGAGDCTDCHAAGAPFHFGRVVAETPGLVEAPVVKVMHELQDLDPLALEVLAASFRGRTLFLWIGFVAGAVVALVLAVHGLRGFEHLLAWRRSARGGAATGRAGRVARLVLAALGASFLVLLVTGFHAWLIAGQPLAGVMLVLHSAAGLVFAAGLALTAVAWADRCRFTPRGDAAPFDAADRGCFWLVCVAGLAAVLTILVGMLPLFAPGALEDLREVHRWSALLASCGIVAYTLRRITDPSAGRRARAAEVGPDPRSRGR